MSVATFSYKGDALQQWSPVHAASLALDASGAAVFTDVAREDWHLIRITRPEFLLSRLKVRLSIEPLQDGGPHLYVHHYGRKDILKVSSHGDVIFCDGGSTANVERYGHRLEIETVFDNTHDSVSIGAATSRDIYTGTGRPLFRIFEIKVEVLEHIDLGKIGWPINERIRLVDVGGAGGLQSKWLEHALVISPTLVEPNPEEATKLQALASRFPGGAVIEKALSNLAGTLPLNITEFWGCTSVRRPNPEVLSGYGIAPAFHVKSQKQVECVRYDALHAQGRAPAPDVIKLDVQGFEFEVLLGFGGLLQTCLAIELEAHFYQIYQGQKLLHDIVALLEDYGLVLRRLAPVPNFDGDLVEVDAVFTQRKSKRVTDDPLVKRKLEIINQVFGL